MKQILLILAMVFMLTGCSTQYATINHKDISVRVRSIWADLDYDSRVAINPGDLKPMEPLIPLLDSEIKPFEPIK